MIHKKTVALDVRMCEDWEIEAIGKRLLETVAARNR